MHVVKYHMAQVLARFEDFPTKKLEALRIAAALYSKLDDVVTTLKNWKIVSPVNQLLDNIEKYFNKVRSRPYNPNHSHAARVCDTN